MIKDRAPVTVTDRDILSGYWGGMTVKSLIAMVAYSERITSRDARERVELVIYNDIMADRKD